MENYCGKRLDGRYEIREIIGVGGMAVVYKAYDVIDDRIVAIKILKEEFLANDEICIRNDTQCLIYNTYGVKHFAYTFDVPIFQILSGASSRSYTFILEGTTEKVKLK